MVPHTFTFIKALPLTANGKIDRKALPRPSCDRMQLKSALEQQITRVWEEVLQQDRIGREDHFFELSGNSLLALQIGMRLREVLHREISMHQLLITLTVVRLVQKMEASQCTEKDQPALPLKSGSRLNPIPLSYFQEQLWFLTRLYPEALMSP